MRYRSMIRVRTVEFSESEQPSTPTPRMHCRWLVDGGHVSVKGPETRLMIPNLPGQKSDGRLQIDTASIAAPARRGCSAIPAYVQRDKHVTRVQRLWNHCPSSSRSRATRR